MVVSLLGCPSAQNGLNSASMNGFGVPEGAPAQATTAKGGCVPYPDCSVSRYICIYSNYVWRSVSFNFSVP
jgi:hypothetical protein